MVASFAPVSSLVAYCSVSSYGNRSFRSAYWDLCVGGSSRLFITTCVAHCCYLLFVWVAPPSSLSLLVLPTGVTCCSSINSIGFLLLLSIGLTAISTGLVLSKSIALIDSILLLVLVVDRFDSCYFSLVTDPHTASSSSSSLSIDFDSCYSCY